MRRLSFIGLLLCLFFASLAQSAAQPLAPQAQRSVAKSEMSNADSAEVGKPSQKRSAALYKSPFGIKFLSGVGGLAIGSLTSSLFVRGNESNPGLGALALLLITLGCAGGVMVSGESYGDRGSFLLSWLGSVGGIAAAFLAFSALPRESDAAIIIAGIGGVLLAPLFSTLLYDLSRTPPQAESGSLFNVKDGKLSFSPLPSVSASYQHPAMRYSVKLIQVQF